MFQISVTCDEDVSRASCAECPNPLKPDSFGNKLCNTGGNGDCNWCTGPTGNGDCEIRRFVTEGNFVGTAALVDLCVSEYFERYLLIYSELPNKQACLLSLFGKFFHHTVNIV